MRLWLLKPRKGLPDADNPWKPWYDKMFGAVVRAATEAEARRTAHDNGCDENDPKTPWLDPHYSTCRELTPDGEPGLVIRDWRDA